MKKTMFSSLVLSGILAFGASAEDFGGTLYVEDVTIAVGGTAVLSVQLDNDIDVSGFQLQLLLPAGITYQGWAISEERLPVGATPKNVLSMQHFDNQKLTLASALNCWVGARFAKSQGELATVTITASPNIPKGTYLVELRGIDVCDPMGNDHEVPSSTFTITVGDPTGQLPIEFTGQEGNAAVYDMQGRHQREVQAGQAGIVNGRAVYRK